MKSDPGKEEVMLVDSDIPAVGDEIDIQEETRTDVPRPTSCAQLVNMPDKSGTKTLRHATDHGTPESDCLPAAADGIHCSYLHRLVFMVGD